MAKEIERKFLVKSRAFMLDAIEADGIVQMYVSGNEGVYISIFASQDKGYVEIDTEQDSWAIAINSSEAHEIAQQDVDNLTVRLRLVNPGTDKVQAFLTVKGKSTEDGLERDEWEYLIEESLLMDIARKLQLVIMSKARYHCPLGDLVIEVDEFTPVDIEDEPQRLAEIEFPVGYDHSQPLTLPEWIGEEVTGNVEYYNSELIKSGKIRTGTIR